MRNALKRHGFTVLELLVALGIIGILFSLGYVAVPRDRIQVNQQTEEIARLLDKARFDAVQRNNFVMVGVEPTNFCVLAVAVRSVPFDRIQDVALLPSDPTDLDCSGGAGVDVIASVPFTTGDNAQISLLTSDAQGGATSDALTLLIDPRGVGQEIRIPGGATITDGEFWLRISHDSGYFRDINVNRYGRTDQQ